ncbi:hypothetical protein RB601_008990 [Gaeumannomyces tritici]
MVQLCDQILSPAFVYWAPIRVRITQYRYWRHVHSDQAPSTRQVWRRSRGVLSDSSADKNGFNVDLSQTETDRLSDAEKDQLILGSKYLQVTWYTYTGFLWCMKACLLFFYDRLKFNLWTYDWVFKALCWATFLSYVQPLPSPECLFQGQNLIVSVVLNILTDAAILSLPLPVLQDLRTPPLKKALVALLICSGFFVISAAAVRLTATLDAAPSAVTINRWGIRECEIGLVAINTPVLRPLFTRKFWARRSSDSRIGGEGDRGAGGAAAHHHHHRGWGRGCCFFGVTLDSLAAPARTNGRGGGGGGGGTWTRDDKLPERSQPMEPPRELETVYQLPARVHRVFLDVCNAPQQDFGIASLWAR